MKKFVCAALALAMTAVFVFTAYASDSLVSQLVTKSSITLPSGERVNAYVQKTSETDIMIAEKKEHESLYAFDLRKKTGTDMYPEITESTVKIGLPAKSGGYSQRAIGKDYRLFFADGENLVQVEITDSNSTEIVFKAKKLGTYALFYDPRVFEIKFYDGTEALDDDGCPIGAYASYTGLVYGEEITPPAVPVRKGYVFKAWTQSSGSGGWTAYSEEKPLKAGECPMYFTALWVKEKNYKPLVINVTHSDIVKGEEDGKKITVSVENSVGFNSEYIADLGDDFTDEFVLFGTDEVTVSKVEYISSKKIILTLSGNSTDKTQTDEYYIGIRNRHLFGLDYQNNCDYGNIKINEYGFMTRYFTSDKAVKLVVPKKPQLADYNGDGQINLTDLNMFMNRMRSENQTETSTLDLNSDTTVDSKDILVLIKNIIENTK